MKKKPPKYTLVFHPKKGYADRRVSVQDNNLEKLLALADKHNKKFTRNPWQYIQIIKNMQFNPFKESETLLFFTVNK